MKDKTKILTTICFYHALNDGGISVVPILFPIFKDMFNLTYSQVGIITSAGLLVTLISQLILGIYSDGKNSRDFLTIGIIIMSFTLFLITTSQGFLMLIFFMILLRFSASFFHPIGVAWISRLYKKDNVDNAMGIQSGFADIGVFIALFTTLYVVELSNWKTPLYIWGIAGIVIVIIGLFLTKNIPKKMLKSEKPKQKINCAHIKKRIKESKEFLKHIKILIPAFIISGSSWGLVLTYLPLLVDAKTKLPLSIVGVIVALWIGAGTIASFLYGGINKKIGRKNVLIVAYICIGITGVLISQITNLTVLIISIIILGITSFIAFPALFAFLSEKNMDGREAGNFGITFTFQLGGGTLLLFAGGVLSDIYGIGMPFLLLGSLSFIYGVFLIIVKKKTFITL